jgi:hypothetical protein
MPSLSNADPVALTEDAVESYCLRSKVILDRPKEDGSSLRQEVDRLDVVSGRSHADAMEGRQTQDRKPTEQGLSLKEQPSQEDRSNNRRSG